MVGYTSKQATEELARNVCKLTDYAEATGGQTDPTLVTWLCGLQPKVKEKLANWGIISTERASAAKLLLDHLVDYEQVLQARGNTDKQVYQVISRAKKIIEGCKFRFFSDISAARVLTFLHDLRKETKNKKGISYQTSNFYLQALKQFCRWMCKERRATESPVEHI